eukprot:10609192-Prorocentrum_lima.AAC.1
MDTETQLSADLYAYFLLEGAGLNDEQKRLVVMCANNKYEATAFVRTLETNYFDLHVDLAPSELAAAEAEAAEHISTRLMLRMARRTRATRKTSMKSKRTK